ncbi:hypothetical protein [Streptomyces phaeochromogenes]|uniref:hypothetical protein n=1 Tax=Streptomyces phaeochromogenes TaxID=1923 RepID=UPI002DDB9E2C|nr:hypothetical protein [Streptomyces phaeochromogenes]WRZ30231.1 hypothetical protein OG931_22000 [Streptomyces phaeochromogenes]
MTTAAQLVGAASISGSVLLLVGLAASLGASSAHHAADRERAAYQREHRLDWAARYAPPPPKAAPTCHVRDETVPLTTVQNRRARHRKGQPTCN